jgi:hypothetical protein
MSGLKKLKESQEAVPVEEEKVVVPTGDTQVSPVNPVVMASPSSPQNEEIWAELNAAAIDTGDAGIFGGLVGHEGTCKSGVLLDSLTPKEVSDGDVIVVIDFDGGGAALRSAYHRDKLANIRCLNPWMMQEEDRTAFDYPATHDRTMKILRTLLRWAQDQKVGAHEGPRLHTVLATGIDLWDGICMNNMKIVDLGAAADGIAAVVNPQKLVGNRWNWQIRTTRFHQVTGMMTRMSTLGIRCWYETHLKQEYVDFDGGTGGTYRPDWEKNTNTYLNQILWFHKVPVRDEKGEPTGETRYEVEFFKSKGNIHLQNQKRVVAVTKEGERAQWFGLPELSDGSLIWGASADER